MSQICNKDPYTVDGYTKPVLLVPVGKGLLGRVRLCQEAISNAEHGGKLIPLATTTTLQKDIKDKWTSYLAGFPISFTSLYHTFTCLKMWFRYLIVFVFLSVVAGNPILLLPKQTSGVSREEAQAVIDVQLRSLTNSTVKVLITNITKEKLRIIRRGGLLDDKLPTKKVVVSRIDKSITASTACLDWMANKR